MTQEDDRSIITKETSKFPVEEAFGANTIKASRAASITSWESSQSTEPQVLKVLNDLDREDTIFMGSAYKRKFERALAIKAIKAGSKVGIAGFQRQLVDLYADIVRENELGKTILKNMADAGDADAKAMLADGRPGMGRIYVQLKATKGDRVAQMVLDALPDDAVG